MDHNIPLQLQYFELHLTILTSRSSHLANSIILFYQSRINETTFEINGGVRIPPNKSATVLLRCLRSAKATDELEIVFVSMDHLCGGDGLNIEVCINGEKAIRWGLEIQTIKLMLETKVCVVTDQRFVTREKVGSRINRFYHNLTSILDDDDEDDDDEKEDVKQVMKGSNDSDRAKKKEKDGQDGDVIKGFILAVKVEIWVDYEPLYSD